MTSTMHSAKVTLPADDQILITREFDAPRELVWQAWTTPELVRRWWHAKRGEMTVCDIDLRPGGAWRFVMIAHGDIEVGFHGSYREVVPCERLVSTEVYEGIPNGEDVPAVNTMTLTDLDGRTRVEILVQHTDQVGRDMHINSGMEDGLQDALDLMEEVARSLSGA